MPFVPLAPCPQNTHTASLRVAPTDAPTPPAPAVQCAASGSALPYIAHGRRAASQTSALSPPAAAAPLSPPPHSRAARAPWPTPAHTHAHMRRGCHASDKAHGSWCWQGGATPAQPGRHAKAGRALMKLLSPLSLPLLLTSTPPFSSLKNARAASCRWEDEQTSSVVTSCLAKAWPCTTGKCCGTAYAHAAICSATGWPHMRNLSTHTLLHAWGMPYGHGASQGPVPASSPPGRTSLSKMSRLTAWLNLRRPDWGSMRISCALGLQETEFYAGVSTGIDLHALHARSQLARHGPPAGEFGDKKVPPSRLAVGQQRHAFLLARRYSTIHRGCHAFSSKESDKLKPPGLWTERARSSTLLNKHQ